MLKSFKKIICGILMSVLIIGMMPLSLFAADHYINDNGEEWSMNGWSARLWISKGSTYDKITVDESTNTVTIKNLKADKANLNNTGNQWTFIFQGKNQINTMTLVRYKTTIQMAGSGSYLSVPKTMNLEASSGQYYSTTVYAGKNTTMLTEEYGFDTELSKVQWTENAVEIGRMGQTLFKYTPDIKPFKNGTKLTSKNLFVYSQGMGSYKVTSAKKGKATAAFTAPQKKTGKSLFIPAHVIDKNAAEYTVNEIAANACKNNKKLKNITINADYVKKIGKDAFKGIPSKATFTIRAKKKSTATALFKKIKKSSGAKNPVFKYEPIE